MMVFTTFGVIKDFSVLYFLHIFVPPFFWMTSILSFIRIIIHLNYENFLSFFFRFLRKNFLHFFYDFLSKFFFFLYQGISLKESYHFLLSSFWQKKGRHFWQFFFLLKISSIYGLRFFLQFYCYSAHTITKNTFFDYKLLVWGILWLIISAQFNLIKTPKFFLTKFIIFSL